jgi:hypothetical protein
MIDPATIPWRSHQQWLPARGETPVEAWPESYNLTWLDPDNKGNQDFGTVPKK